MPKFFFNIYNTTTTIDYEGLEAANVDDAKARAVREFRSLIAASVLENGELILDHRIDVLNAERERVGRVYLRDALTIRDQRGTKLNLSVSV